MCSAFEHAGHGGQLLSLLEGRSCQLQGMSPLFKTILVVSLGHRIAAMYQNLQSLRLTWLGGFTPTRTSSGRGLRSPCSLSTSGLSAGTRLCLHLLPGCGSGRSHLKCCHPLGPRVIKTRQSFHCVNAPGGQTWFYVTAMAMLRSAEGNCPRT